MAVYVPVYMPVHGKKKNLHITILDISGIIGYLK
jgi:hypothetical protein